MSENKNTFHTNIPSIEVARKRLKESLTRNDIFSISKSQSCLGNGLKFFVKTYGCQSNIRDTETLNGILIKMGYTKASDVENADLVILNTCAVRENAEKKVFGEIGFLKNQRKKNKNFLFGICGCMAQEETVIKKIIEKLQHVDIVFGTHNIYDLPNIIEQRIETGSTVIKVISEEGDVIENLPVLRTNKFKAFVNIMFGCDNFCTYCIVPYTRGQIRSRAKEDILKEINDLIKSGCVEVTLLGQNVNSYGIDFKNKKYSFCDLLEDVAKTNISRIRFATSNPWNFSRDIVNVMKKYDNIMPYIHIPVQSGDEKILAKMNRKMKISDYVSLIEHIKEEIPNCTISTDLIVGFPNETDEQFENTISLYHKIKFDNAYTFIYSPRSGTSAALIDDKISYEEKSKRLQKLNVLVKNYAKENNEKWVGKIVEVLVEGKSKTNPNILTGYSPEWKVINFKGRCAVGKIARVKILSASRFSLNGIKVI